MHTKKVLFAVSSVAVVVILALIVWRSNGTPALTVEQVKNSTYDFGPDGLGPAKFEDGEYRQKINEGTEMEWNIYALIFDEKSIALGDIDGDGRGDAAVFVYENSGGGNGWATYLVVLKNVRGVPKQVGKAYFIDQQAKLEKLEIKNGEILLSALVHTDKDGHCCPSLHKDFRFKFDGTELRAVSN